jgi:hypothetical protein
MQAFQKSGKTLIIVGVVLLAIGFGCMFLNLVTGVGNFFLIDVWGVLSAAGFFYGILGAIAFCMGAPPRTIVRGAGLAAIVILLAFIALAILTPNANVHGPVMPVIVALVAFGAIALLVLLTGLIRLAMGRGKQFQ